MNGSDFKIICGHYGVGKTNTCLNLAVDTAKAGKEVVVVDLDLVNPYFRISDYKYILKKYNIKLIASNFANTNLDIPSIPAEMYSVFNDDGKAIIIDVGGDDVGSTVLGRFSGTIKENILGYEMYYVINKYRRETSTIEGATRILKEIEKASRLKATGVINNSHLKNETSINTILDSVEYTKEFCEYVKLPLVMTTVCNNFVSEKKNQIPQLYNVNTFSLENNTF